jgi:hypothetical protein
MKIDKENLENSKLTNEKWELFVTTLNHALPLYKIENK